MLTNPSTLGLFEPQIEEIAEIVHGVGATLYYDGANLNAIMGICRPGDMGFDIVHFNLHKSFTQPHGGGGPGAGPIAVSDRIEPFLPRPQVVRRRRPRRQRRRRWSPSTTSTTTGRSRSAGCAASRATTACSCAPTPTSARSAPPGLREVSEVAVLNANYLLARLREEGVLEYLPVAYERLCMHEFVLSGAPMKRELGIKTLDLAKRLLDHGVHPPTVYFPLIVDEALLVEPTETETRETLDRFAEIVAEILREAAEDPEIARGGAVHDARAPARRGRPPPAIRSCVSSSPSRSGAWTWRSPSAPASWHRARSPSWSSWSRISTPSGDVAGGRAGVRALSQVLPAARRSSGCRARPTGCAPDLIATGSPAPAPPADAARPRRHGRSRTPSTGRCERDGERLYGSGTADMKGGVAVAARGRPRAAPSSPDDVRASWRCCWSATRSGGSRRSRTSSASPATTPACASRPVSAIGEDGRRA